MNLAIEYILRNNKICNLLSTPCSLFVENNDKKMVITLGNTYGKSDIIVKHWLLYEATCDMKLPSFNEYSIKKEDIFTSDKVIVPGYELLVYQEEPFPESKRQFSEFPFDLQQQEEYEQYHRRFFNSRKNSKMRLNWLWSIFETIYLTEEFQLKHGFQTPNGVIIQREIVEVYDKKNWYIWKTWQKYMLNFTGVATELIFKNFYPPVKTAKTNKNLFQSIHI